MSKSPQPPGTKTSQHCNMEVHRVFNSNRGFPMKPNTISTGHCFSKWRCHCFSKWRCAASRGHHACAPTPRFCKSSLTLEKVPRCSQRCPCAPKRRPPQEVLRFLLKPTFELLKGDKYRKFGLRSQIFSAKRSNALPSISWWTCRHEQRAIKHLPDVCTFPMCRCQRDATWERNPTQRGPLDKDSAMCRKGSPFEACNRSIAPSGRRRQGDSESDSSSASTLPLHWCRPG